MTYTKMRNELKDFYWQGDDIRAKRLADKIFAILDSKKTEDMTPVALKVLQYGVIAEKFEPVLFRNCPYYFETSIITSCCDGCGWAVKKGHHFAQANAWANMQNGYLYKERDPELHEKLSAQRSELLYLFSNEYWDSQQHFNFNNRPILAGGLKSVYEKAKAQLDTAENDKQREFLRGIMSGMLAIKRIAERFSEKAADMLKSETDAEVVRNLERICNTAKRVPWEAPTTLYEALNTLAFMRKALGSLEGVGPNTFGRIDMDLYPFYKHDIESGILTKDDAYELIAQFLITFDMHYDHDMKMVGYADHELENTYTLGGCDFDGKPFCNELTLMFLTANREEKIIFPKIKVRFSKDSPKEYLDEINRSVIKGTSTILYSNDDAVIPSLVRAGRPIEEARDYLISGCWGIACYQEKFDHGAYFNLLKPFEFALHKLYDKIEKVGIDFKVFEGDETFEELYGKILYNTEAMLRSRNDIIRRGIGIRNDVVSHPIFSSTLKNCIENMANFTDGGAKYYDDFLLMFGLPNIVDSLMAIKTLCFDKKVCTLSEMLTAVRNNWEGFEELRSLAIKCHGWGDGNEDSCTLASRFNNDLYEICGKVEGTCGGKIHMGHLTYTEIRWWGEKTLATPDGRYSGEYFAQGLTPSRLKKIPSVTDVITSLRALDRSTLAANSVFNIILPAGKTDLATCEAFLRAAADSAMESLQLNVTSKEQLLDAQKHPELYPDLIVRVTGFSARFTSLSEGWQDEVLTRNFYK
ncbi:MAG: hypothetical protein E7583_04410 [Ruminococcaceae bacterium]|nr:hypothetical protein [Oscillospiraceae bacterium]